MLLSPPFFIWAIQVKIYLVFLTNIRREKGKILFCWTKIINFIEFHGKILLYFFCKIFPFFILIQQKGSAN